MWIERFWGDRGALSSWWCLFNILLCSFQPFIKSSLSYHFEDYLRKLMSFTFFSGLNKLLTTCGIPVQIKYKVWITKDEIMNFIEFNSLISSRFKFIICTLISHGASFSFFNEKKHPKLFEFYCQRVSLQF